MKFFIISCFFIFFGCALFAQETNYARKIFKDVSPKSLNCSISFNVRVRNEKGEVVGIRNIMNISNLYLKERIDNYTNKQELIQYLIKELTGEYAWDANIILYYLTEVDCINMFSYQPNKIDEWIKREKDNCLKFWTNYSPVTPEGK